MILYPKFYCDKITDITVEMLEKNNIKGLMLDIDNTIIDGDKNLIDGITEWIEKIKSHNIKCIIVSNTNKLDKVNKVANALEIPYIYFATKPLKRGFKKAKNQLNLEYENIASIGDQIFTDVLGANCLKMFSILVNPIGNKEHMLTKIKRPIESLVIKSYVKSNTRREK